MTDSQSLLSSKRKHDKGLVLIAAYKFVQAFLFAAVGVGAVRLLHKDAADVLAKVADHLHFNSEWRLVTFILDKASLLKDPLLRRIELAAFSYAALGILEGTGLYLEKVWAEYLTLAITGSFLPWEIFEVLRKVTWIRAGLLVVNSLVFFYLLKIVVERGKDRRGPREGVEV